MESHRHIHHHYHRFGYSYATSPWQRAYSGIIAPALILIALGVVVKIFSLFPLALHSATSPAYFMNALVATTVRLLIAYLLALIVSLPLALLINHSPLFERILLPLFDIVQSIPVLVFFPVVILFFIHVRALNGAAIVILFLSMLWNLVFSMVGGLNVIPREVKSAAHVFKVRGINYLRAIVIPSITPSIVTGSLLAWAQGWNIVIVAEVLHTYIPNGTPQQDLFGVGSILVNAVAQGRTDIFIGALVVMVAMIAFMNVFIWQKLLRYAEKFKFE